MKKLNYADVSELKIALADFFDEEGIEEIFKLYTHEEIVDILHQEREENSAMNSATSKHVPSRKKKANRIKSHSTTTEYKKQKAKKWIEKRRKDIKTNDVTNRSYLNKASKQYTKLHPHVKPKSK